MTDAKVYQTHNALIESRRILAQYKDSHPSLIVTLGEKDWSIKPGRPAGAASQKQLKPLPYNHPIVSLLDDVFARRVPNDYLEILDHFKVTWYEGCLIVELVDQRPSQNQVMPEKFVLRSNSQTLWTDIRRKITQDALGDREALELESRYLLATTAPLCLDPSPSVNRTGNVIARAAAATPARPSLKRKQMDDSEEEAENARNLKRMHFMNPRTVADQTTFKICDYFKRARPASTAPNVPPIPRPPTAPNGVNQLTNGGLVQEANKRPNLTIKFQPPTNRPPTNPPNGHVPNSQHPPAPAPAPAPVPAPAPATQSVPPVAEVAKAQAVPGSNPEVLKAVIAQQDAKGFSLRLPPGRRNAIVGNLPQIPARTATPTYPQNATPPAMSVARPPSTQPIPPNRIATPAQAQTNPTQVPSRPGTSMGGALTNLNSYHNSLPHLHQQNNLQASAVNGTPQLGSKMPPGLNSANPMFNGTGVHMAGSMPHNNQANPHVPLPNTTLLSGQTLDAQQLQIYRLAIQQKQQEQQRQQQQNALQQNSLQQNALQQNALGQLRNANGLPHAPGPSGLNATMAMNGQQMGTGQPLVGGTMPNFNPQQLQAHINTAFQNSIANLKHRSHQQMTNMFSAAPEVQDEFLGRAPRTLSDNPAWHAATREMRIKALLEHQFKLQMQAMTQSYKSGNFARQFLSRNGALSMMNMNGQVVAGGAVNPTMQAAMGANMMGARPMPNPQMMGMQNIGYKGLPQ